MSGRLRILCVDDERNVLKSLERVFLDEEYEIVTASSGNEGLGLLENDSDFAVIITDQRMPEMTGTEFLTLARKVAPDAVRILLTGYSDLLATIDAINKGGASRYITKPWSDKDLLQAVRESVKHYGLLLENRRLTELVNRQNEELKEWNGNLKHRVLDQTSELRKKNGELQELISRLRKNFEDTIDAFSNLVELHNPGVRSHSRIVARIAVRAAELEGCSEQELESVRVAALLHDIGKITNYDGLSRGGAGDDGGHDLTGYVLHPVRGQATVEGVEDLRSVGVLIRHHHESHDGSGFPDRLRGAEIPSGAQLIGMADFLENRLRHTFGEHAVELALAELKTLLGSRFNPALFVSVAEATRHVFAVFHPKHDLEECAVSFKNLSERMVLSRDLCSGTGLLLLSRGTELDADKIMTLQHFYRLDPPHELVYVFARRQQPSGQR